MRTHIIEAVILTVACTILSSCSYFSSTTREPYYPRLSNSIFSDESLTLIETNNVVIKAIKSNRYVSVSDFQGVNDVAKIVFNEAEVSSAVSISDVQTSLFHHALESIIKQFTCEVFTSKHPNSSIQLCPLSKSATMSAEHALPFIGGIRLKHRLSTTIHNDPAGLEFELFLRSVQERSLDTLWGAVHELGKIPNSELAQDSLVLTINMNIHKKNDLDRRWRSLHHEPLVFFVILPPVESIWRSKNEIESMSFAYKKAVLLVVDSR
ncbi:hypothetical protein [Vibrio tetraodonis]|uniref:hypothetical protein n=1 Tax=Vibrio tetraodonis TaxID=2231647 RepID=UPI000E0BE8C6|nr:hypothetical protein [Vibrio tetraodonis]